MSDGTTGQKGTFTDINIRNSASGAFLWRIMQNIAALTTTLFFFNVTSGFTITLNDVGANANIITDQGAFTVNGSWNWSASNNTPIVFGPINSGIDQSQKIFAAKRSAGTFNVFNIISWNGFTSNNNINIGGNSGAAAAATNINFYAAATIDTASGTLIAAITTAGLSLFPTTNQLVLNNTTINCPTSSSPTTLSTYDVSSVTTTPQVKLGVLNVVTINSVTTLTVAQSGTLFKVAQTSTYAITVPTASAAAGVTYDFIINSNANNTVTIVPATGTPFQGVVVQPTGNVVATLNGATITFVAHNAGAGSNGGDHIRLTCNGLVWSVFAVTTNNGGITIA